MQLLFLTTLILSAPAPNPKPKPTCWLFGTCGSDGMSFGAAGGVAEPAPAVAGASGGYRGAPALAAYF